MIEIAQKFQVRDGPVTRPCMPYKGLARSPLAGGRVGEIEPRVHARRLKHRRIVGEGQAGSSVHGRLFSFLFAFLFSCEAAVRGVHAGSLTLKGLRRRSSREAWATQLCLASSRDTSPRSTRTACRFPFPSESPRDPCPNRASRTRASPFTYSAVCAGVRTKSKTSRPQEHPPWCMCVGRCGRQV